MTEPAERPETEKPLPTNVVAAIAAVMAEIGGIRKMSTAERRKLGLGGGDEGSGLQYSYRGVDQLAQAAQPLFGKYGVVTVPKVLSTEVTPITVNGKPWTDMLVEVEWTLYGPGGVDDRITAVTAGQGRDGGDKNAAKCLTNAFKNLLLRILCIGDPADDVDGHTVDADAGQPTGNGKRETTTVDPQNDPVLDTFRRVQALSGSPLADAVKEYAARAKKPLTPKRFHEDPEWRVEIGLFIDEQEKPAEPTTEASFVEPATPGAGMMHDDESTEPVKPKRAKTAREMATEKEGT